MPWQRSAAHYGLLALALASVAVVFALAAFLTPDERGFGTHEQLGLPPCYSAEWFGLPCPACGVTTAVVLFGRGAWRASFVTQPFGFGLALGALVFVAWGLLAHVRGLDFFEQVRRRWHGRTWSAALALALAAWVYRLAG